MSKIIFVVVVKCLVLSKNTAKKIMGGGLVGGIPEDFLFFLLVIHQKQLRRVDENHFENRPFIPRGYHRLESLVAF